MNNLYSQQKTNFYFISKKNAISTTQALKKTFYLKIYPKITLHIRTFTLDGRLTYTFWTFYSQTLLFDLTFSEESVHTRKCKIIVR